MSNEHVNALLVARSKINNGTHAYICNALPWCNKEGDEIREQIKLDLNGYGTLYEWLLSHFPEKTLDKFIFSERNNKLRKIRLAWIDAMIEYWRDKP